MDHDDWIDSLAARLAQATRWGYGASSRTAAEPAAMVALALISLGKNKAAAAPLAWLAQKQRSDGSLNASDEPSSPKWPTSLAVLAWTAALQTKTSSQSSLPAQTDRAVSWILSIQGATGDGHGQLVHDTTLTAWPWVEETHNWVEPTALHVLALKAVGKKDHPRTRQGVAMLVDRLLPHGGCNYGNTIVLGQELRPHVQPTGLALAALADENIADPRIQKSLDWLADAVSPQTTTASLCFGLFGLAAHDRLPENSPRFLQAAYHRTVARDASPYKLALLAIASRGVDAPLFALSREGASP
jgi:hypothetical protein